MQVKNLLAICCLWPALLAAEQQTATEADEDSPDMELLEFLGNLEGDEQSWRDALWLLDDELVENEYEENAD